VTISLDEVLAMTERYSNWGRFGPDDELGTINFITEKNILEGVQAVQTGRAFSLAIPLDAEGPQTGGFGRFNPIHLMLRDGGDAITGATVRDFYGGVDRQIRGTDDMIIMPLQCATQWDSLAHVVHDGHIYNGYSAAEVSSRGARRNGIDKARDRIVSRGVLLDVARAQGKRWLEPGEGITSADLAAAADAHGIDVHEGDLVMIRTGQLAMVRDRESWGDYAGGPAPGLALDSLEWIHDHAVGGIATDTWGAEVLPNETENVFQPFHVVAIPYMGLLIGEIWDLEELADACAADGRYDCLLSAFPLTITGAVGSPINPMALR
jgi:kynurenine formamidase